MTAARLDPASRAARAVFVSAAGIALYTAAGFGVLLYLGTGQAEACALAATAGVIGAIIAALLVHRREIGERRRRVVQAQMEMMREKTLAMPARRTEAPGRSMELRAGESRSREIRSMESRSMEIEGRDARESREIQTALLPRSVPSLPGYHFEVDYLPCGALGGDFYDFRYLSEGRILLTLGDVSGKGAAGAIVMAMVQTLFRENAPSASGPADLLARVNGGFCGTLGKGVFVTAVAAMLDPVRHRLTVAGAGHHPLLLLNATERKTTRVSARGLALGLMGGSPFAESLVETTIDLGKGDSLLFYTDGATDGVQDLANGGGETRFLAAAAAAVLPGASGALRRLAEDLWQGGGRRDDTTLLLLSRLGEVAPRTDAAATTMELKV